MPILASRVIGRWHVLASSPRCDLPNLENYWIPYFYKLCEYLHEILLRSSHCETNLAETIFRRVLVCPTFSAPRVQLLLKLGYNPASTITILQSNCPDQLNALNTFLSDCKRITKTQSASKFRVQYTELISNPSMEH